MFICHDIPFLFLQIQGEVYEYLNLLDLNVMNI